MEVTAAPPPPPPTPPSHSTVVATQTSPLEEEQVHHRTTLPPATLPPATLPPATLPSATQPVRGREGGYALNSFDCFLLLLQAVSVQYVPIPSQSPTIIIPTVQPAIPYMVPQVSTLKSMV